MRTKLECPVCKSNIYKGQNSEIIPKKKGQKRILALDQATHLTGWSIFDGKELVKYGVFSTDLDEEIARDNAIKNWLLSMIESWRPDQIGIEGVQYQEEVSGKKISVTVFQALARLQGILMEACYEAKVPYTICPTNTWRNHCGVKGKYRVDKKRSMQIHTKQWYDISVSDDEADAIGIGKYMADQFNIIVENWE